MFIINWSSTYTCYSILFVLKYTYCIYNCYFPSSGPFQFYREPVGNVYISWYLQGVHDLHANCVRDIIYWNLHLSTWQYVDILIFILLQRNTFCCCASVRATFILISWTFNISCILCVSFQIGRAYWEILDQTRCLYSISPIFLFTVGWMHRYMCPIYDLKGRGTNSEWVLDGCTVVCSPSMDLSKGRGQR